MCPIWTHTRHAPYARIMTCIWERPLLAHDHTSNASTICHVVCSIPLCSATVSPT
jgi:hypothetical protein